MQDPSLIWRDVQAAREPFRAARIVVIACLTFILFTLLAFGVVAFAEHFVAAWDCSRSMPSIDGGCRLDYR